jgi:hypothetical protein
LEDSAEGRLKAPCHRRPVAPARAAAAERLGAQLVHLAWERFGAVAQAAEVRRRVRADSRFVRNEVLGEKGGEAVVGVPAERVPGRERRGSGSTVRRRGGGVPRWLSRSAIAWRARCGRARSIRIQAIYKRGVCGGIAEAMRSLLRG